MSKYYFGIDLGTTNSAISYIEEEKEVPTIIELENGYSTLPSCVMLSENNGKEEYIIGRDAYESRGSLAVCYSVKKLMGTNTKVKLIGETLTVEKSPEEISSMILKELVRQAELTFGKGTVKDVVITVPAYFNNKQRLATKKAGELAGLNVTKIINEPTSASILYGLEKSSKSETILAYDLGGGTFDVTLLNVVKGTKSHKGYPLLGIPAGFGVNEGVDIIYSDGDTRLGGDDLDKYLAKMLVEIVQKDYKYTIRPDEMEKYILRLEKIKKRGGGIVGVEIKGKKEYVEITEEMFKKATKYILDKTMVIVNRCLRHGVGTIDKIVLVGGSTKNKWLQEMLQAEFPGTEMLSNYKPDESVALGASIQALADKSGFVSINDIVPLSLGIKAKDEDGKFVRSSIITHGDSLPCKRFKVYNVEKNNGTLELEVFQGDSIYLEECNFLGMLKYEIPQDCKELGIQFLVDLNGLLTCSVVTSQGEQQLELANIFNQEVKVIDINDKKYIRWTKLLSDKGADEKTMEEFNKAFSVGKGAEFIKGFREGLLKREQVEDTNTKELKVKRVGKKKEK